MKKKLRAFSILVIGLSMVAYGFVTAPISNGSEILSHYECDRITKDSRPTYCFNLSSAPEAKKDYGNTFVYTGVTLAVLGGLYYLVVMNPKKK